MRAAAFTTLHQDSNDDATIDWDAEWDTTQCRHLKAAVDAPHCDECGATLDHDDTTSRITLRNWWQQIPPRVRRQRVRTAVVFTAVIAALAGIWQVTETWTGPAAPVNDVIEALESGDPAAVMQTLNPSDLTSITESPLLKPAAINAGYTPPSNIDITDVSHGAPKGAKTKPNHDYARVSLTYELADKQVNSEVIVTKPDGWMATWQVAATDILAQVTVNPSHTESGGYRIATVTSTTTTWHALPGVYAVTAEGDALYHSQSVTVIAGMGERAAADLGKPRIKERVHHEIIAQVRAHVEQCVTASKLKPECGFESATAIAEPMRGEWTINNYPEIRFKTQRYPEPSGNTSAPTRELLVVSTATAGKATTTSHAKQQTADIYLHGYITIDANNKPKFHPTACQPFARTCDGERMWRRGTRP